MRSVWFRFFRVRNLMTVPGDALVGAAAVLAFSHECISACWLKIAVACVVGVLLYMFGLADNDIVGAKTDPKTRPLANGEMSMKAAKVARALCLVAVALVGFAAGMPWPWWATAGLLVLAIVIYNRTKWCLMMGACRGLDVLCGAAAVFVPAREGAMNGLVAAIIAGLVWTAYIAGVTKFSEREVFDPTNDHKVALLVYGLMGLQAVALVVFFLIGM